MPTLSFEEKLKDEFIELVEKSFPKGTEGRGAASVLIAYCIERATELHNQDIQEAHKRGYVQGGLDEILRHEDASKVVTKEIKK